MEIDRRQQPSHGGFKPVRLRPQRPQSPPCGEPSGHSSPWLPTKQHHALGGLCLRTGTTSHILACAADLYTAPSPPPSGLNGGSGGWNLSPLAEDAELVRGEIFDGDDDELELTFPRLAGVGSFASWSMPWHSTVNDRTLLLYLWLEELFVPVESYLALGVCNMADIEHRSAFGVGRMVEHRVGGQRAGLVQINEGQSCVAWAGDGIKGFEPQVGYVFMPPQDSNLRLWVAWGRLGAASGPTAQIRTYTAAYHCTS